MEEVGQSRAGISHERCGRPEKKGRGREDPRDAAHRSDVVRPLGLLRDPQESEHGLHHLLEEHSAEDL